MIRQGGCRHLQKNPPNQTGSPLLDKENAMERDMRKEEKRPKSRKVAPGDLPPVITVLAATERASQLTAPTAALLSHHLNSHSQKSMRTGKRTGMREKRMPVKRRRWLPETWEPPARRQPPDDCAEHHTNTGKGRGWAGGGESPELRSKTASHYFVKNLKICNIVIIVIQSTNLRASVAYLLAPKERKEEKR